MGFLQLALGCEDVAFELGEVVGAGDVCIGECEGVNLGTDFLANCTCVDFIYEGLNIDRQAVSLSSGL